jgi:hypothetical protein
MKKTNEEKTRHRKIVWMAVWAANNGLQLVLDGEVGICRKCVGVSANDQYPSYYWYKEGGYDDEVDRIDNNGRVWYPKDAYHKHPCVAVLGTGIEAEDQLYKWLRWFDKHGFVVEKGFNERPKDRPYEVVEIIMGKHTYARMVRKEKVKK